MNKLFYRILLVLIVFGCIFLLFSKSANASTKDYYVEQDTAANYMNYGVHDFHTYGRTDLSYMYRNSDGTISTVVWGNSSNTGDIGVVIVEKYDSNFQYIDGSRKEISYELDWRGGFYSGSVYNYLIFGQSNTECSSTKEVLRVVKYDKDWNRLGSCSFSNIDSYEIFDAASCRMDEVNGYLYIVTAGTMAKVYSIDNLHHQGDKILRVNIETMQGEEIDSSVSHSFNQFITSDDDRFYVLQHGDGFPRGIAFSINQKDKNIKSLGYKTIIKIGGDPDVDKNATGMGIGGFEVGDTNCILAGNSIVQQETNDYTENRNIFVATIPKQNYGGMADIKWITNYEPHGNVKCRTPHLTKVNNNCFIVTWEEYDVGKSLNVKMVMVDENGNMISKIVTVNGRTSDCVPIVYNGELTWFITRKQKMVFFHIDITSKEAFEAYDGTGLINLADYEHFEGKMQMHGSEPQTYYRYIFSNFDNKVSSIEVPDVVNPWTEVVIDGGTFEETDVKEVIIPEGYTIIPGSCFRNCKKLKNVQMSNTITVICSYAFLGSTLEKISIPKSVKEIQNYAFYNMDFLEEIEFPDGIEVISSSVCADCQSLRKVIIPDSVKNIEDSAFYLTPLKEINIPEFVETIGESAFSANSYILGDIVIPENVTKIENHAFAYNYNADKLIVKNSNTIFGKEIFTNRKDLVVGDKYKPFEGIRFSSASYKGDNCVTISEDGTITATAKGNAYVYYYDGDGNVILYTQITVYQSSQPLLGMTPSKEVCYLMPGEVYNASVTTNPTSTSDKSLVEWKSDDKYIAWTNCDGRILALSKGTTYVTGTSVVNSNIKVRIKVVVDDSFDNLYEYQVLSDKTIKIKKYFGDNEVVNIPSSIDGYVVSELDSYIFGEYNSFNYTLKKVTIPDTVKKMGSAFAYCKELEEVFIPAGVTQIYQGFSNGNDKLKSINVAEDNQNYISVDGVLYKKSGESPYILVSYPQGKDDKKYVIPSTVRTIDGWSIYKNEYLEEIDCLKNVTRLNSNGIKECSNLKKLYILANNMYFDSIQKPIQDCPNLTIYSLKDSTAQTFANENNINFEEIDIKITSLTADITSYNFTKTTEYAYISTKIEPLLATNTELTYTSNDTNVVAVSGTGRIRPVGNGTTTIRVDTTDGSNKSVIITVNVDFKCTGIKTPLGTSVDVSYGRTGYVTAYAIPSTANNKTLEYTVKDSSIATVDDSGRVTPLKNGSTEVYVRTTDGSDLMATFQVNVSGVPETMYTVRFLTIEGNELANQKVKAGASVNLPTITEKEGYTFDGWYKEAKCVNKYENEAVTGDLILYGRWKEKLRYPDVKKNDWFYDAVEYVSSRGMMNGYTAGENKGMFGPLDNITRGQIVTILYRIEGQPVVSGVLDFLDKNDSTSWSSYYYNNAILWASQKEIVTGYKNGENAGKFLPDKPITRAEFAIILQRYAKAKGISINDTASLIGFYDYEQVEDWEKAGLAWTVAKGIISGDKVTTPPSLKPHGNTTRAEAAMMIMRFCENVK